MTGGLSRTPAQFFFGVGYGACFAEVMIRNGMTAPFELSDAHMEAAWTRSVEAHEDPAEIDRLLALVDTAPDLLEVTRTLLAFTKGTIERAGLRDTNGVVAAAEAVIAKATGAA